MKPLKYGQDEHRIRTSIVSGEYVEQELEFYEETEETEEEYG